MLRNRCHFLGAIAGFTTVAATARDLWSQLVGSIGQRAGPGNRDQWSTVFVLRGTGYFGFQTHPEVLQAKAVADFGVC